MIDWESKIEALLTTFNCNISQLESKIGVGNGYINGIKTGRNKNPNKLIQSLIEVFRINPKWFYNDTIPMFQEEVETKDLISTVISDLIKSDTAPKFSEQDTRLNNIEELLQKHDEAIKQIQRSRIAAEQQPEIIEDRAPKYTAVKAAAGQPATEDDYEEEYIDLPLAVNLAAGVPIEATDTGDTYPVPLRLIPKKPGSQYCAAQIAGTSMTESGIYDGDYVLLEYFDEPINNEFMVVKYGSETTLKLLRRNKRGGWELWYQDGSGQKIALQDGDWEVKGKFICVLPKRP